MKLFYQGTERIWIKTVMSLILAAILFAFGYWQGHRSQQQETLNGNVPLQLNHYNRPDTPILPVAGIPANASPALKEFLENRAKLAESFARLRSQGTNGAPNPVTFAQFHDQNKALLDRQRELAQELANQQEKNPLPMPALQIPPNASPQMQAFLTTRDQLVRDQVAFMNQHQTDDSQARQTAMQLWRQQNAARYAQLQQLAQALSQPNTATTN